MVAALATLAAALAAVAVIAYLLLSRRRPVATASQAQTWTGAAGDEFSDLDESGRCDMIFALAALEDPQSLTLLEKALDDPSETVALAAAHALASRGGAPRIAQYFAAHPGQRAERLAQTLALFESGVTPSS